MNTIINARFHSIDEKIQSSNGLDTIGFDTQQYFKEGYRLSLNPKLLKKSERHPIFSYVPENFNFSAGKKFYRICFFIEEIIYHKIKAFLRRIKICTIEQKLPRQNLKGVVSFDS